MFLNAVPDSIDWSATTGWAAYPPGSDTVEWYAGGTVQGRTTGIRPLFHPEYGTLIAVTDGSVNVPTFYGQQYMQRFGVSLEKLIAGGAQPSIASTTQSIPIAPPPPPPPPPPPAAIAAPSPPPAATAALAPPPAVAPVPVFPGAMPVTTPAPSGRQVVIRDYGAAPSGATLTSFESDNGITPQAPAPEKKGGAWAWLLAALGAFSIFR